MAFIFGRDSIEGYIPLLMLFVGVSTMLHRRSCLDVASTRLIGSTVENEMYDYCKMMLFGRRDMVAKVDLL